MPANLESVRQEVGDKLEDMRDELAQYVTTEERFINNYDGFFTYDHNIGFQGKIHIALDSLDSIHAILDKSLEAVINYDLPERPPILDSEIDRYNEHVYSDSRLNFLDNSMHDLYSSIEKNTGYDIGYGSKEESIVAAKVKLGFQQKNKELIDVIEDLGYEWSSDGYELPPSALSYYATKKIYESNKERRSKTEYVFNELMLKIESNVKEAFTLGASIEDLHMDFAIKFSELQFLEIENATKAYIAQIEKIIDEIEAPLLNIASIIKAARIDVSANYEEYSLKLDEAIGNLQAYVTAQNALISSEAGYLKQKVDLSISAAKAYGSIFTSYGSLFTGIALEEQSADSTE